MTTTLKIPCEKLFSASGSDLKLTKNNSPPCCFKKGECTLSRTKGLQSYDLKISDGCKSKQLSFKLHNSNIDVKSRNKQFTITIFINCNANLLCGSLSDENQTNELLKILKGLYNNQPKSSMNATSTSTGWLSKTNFQENPTTKRPKTPKLKENNNIFGTHDHTKVTKTYSKNRVPLKQVGGSNNGIFPSPSSLLKNSSKGNVFDEADDCKITAVGAHKTSAFYSNVKKKAETIFAFRRFKYRKTAEASPTLSKSPEVVGFANLGNTCYMNAILQCLLNIPNFYQELENQKNIELVDHESLYNRLCSLGYMKQFQESTQNHKAALQMVKTAISSAAKRFSGYAQHDAHEFLCQCLDQLKEDLATKVSLTSPNSESNLLYTCPIKDNFESTIVHSIKCLACDEEIVKEETCHDFSLVIPDNDENTVPNGLGITALLKLYFGSELIDYSCDKCGGDQSVLSHHFQKLPRLMVLHLKRYDVYHAKRSDHICISKTLTIHEKLTLDTTQPPKSFVLKLGNENNKSTGLKRKLSDSLLNNIPKAKTPKQWPTSSSFYRNISREGELMAMAARDSQRDEELKKKNDFTEIQDVRRELNFNSSSDVTAASSAADESERNMLPKPFDSVIGNEDQELQRVLELSMREFEEQQRADMEQFTSIGEKSAAATTSELKEEAVKFSPSNFVDLAAEADEENVSSTYKLVGIVNHHGLNTESGHYTCDCYDFKSKQWRSYDDSSVKDVSENAVHNSRSKSGYIVFYMHSSCYDSIASKY